MNFLTKVLMGAALLVIGYFLFIGLFYVVAAGALLLLGLYGFSSIQRLWRRWFGSAEAADNATYANRQSPFFSVRVQQWGADGSSRGPQSGSSALFEREGAAGPGPKSKPQRIKIIDVN